MIQNLLLIVVSVLLNASAQLFIRKGMLLVGKVNVSLQNLFSLTQTMFTNIWLLFGLSCYAISVLLWMAVLSRVNVSIAYPFLSIGYIFTAFLGYVLFNEPLTLQKIAGIFVICVGVWLLTQTGELS